MRTEYYVKVQCKKTQIYEKTRIDEKKQHYQRIITLPAQLCKVYDLEKGHIVRLVINGNGEITLKKTESKPISMPMKYEEWIAKIKPHIPTSGVGKTYAEICKEANLTMRAAPAEWVHKAQFEICLNKARDKQTRHIVWTRTALPDGKDQKPKETKLRELTLGEFQAK
jgi:bifunctional DNA-binding transcriptional regulator/antitoxin component of YhaV-PrlF toxin-antitoxin module